MSDDRSFRDELALLLKARFPLLYVESYEEARVLAEIRAVAADPARIRTPRPVWVWSSTGGLVDPDGSTVTASTDPGRAIDIAARHDEPAVFVFCDLHSSLGAGGRPEDAAVVRRLRETAAAFQTGAVARALVIVAPELCIPTDLGKDITIVDFALPSTAEIRDTLDAMVAANAQSGRIRVDLDEQGRERLVSAARGLTLQEAENAFARAIVRDGTLTADDVRIVTDEKRQTIRKSGVLEYVTTELDLDDVGGLQNLKRWLAKRNNSWLAEASAYGLPSPRGVLITGVPGCGKSLTAKAVAAAWQLPLLRLDVGRVFSGLVGSSEQNMRSALRAAEAIAPCILWIDEIEKGFAGASGGAGDSGTSSRVFGSFLSWMQDKSAPVFVIATANNIDALPPEFLRKGRFDEIFFVDLPTAAERRQIWRLHVGKALTRPAVAGALALDAQTLDALAGASEGYSGAEIEQAVIAALFDAYNDQRPLTLDDLRRAVGTMVPLSVTMAPQISAIRSWASVRAVGATASEDLGGYASTDAATEPGEARGGRLVDF